MSKRSQNDLSKGNKVLVYFSPICHFCQVEAEELSKIYSQYPDKKMVIYCKEPLDEIRAFCKKYNLNDKKNILW